VKSVRFLPQLSYPGFMICAHGHEKGSTAVQWVASLSWRFASSLAM
jgi:hypothetical protein